MYWKEYQKRKPDYSLLLLLLLLSFSGSKNEQYAEGILQYLPKDENFNTHTHQTPNYLSSLLNSSTGFHFGLLVIWFSPKILYMDYRRCI